MLTIRPEQVEALRVAQYADFRRRAMRHLADVLPSYAASLGDEGLAAMIDAGVDRCRPLGVTRERDVVRYLEYTLAYGASFEREPEFDWAAAILDAPDLDGSAKMDRIDEEYERLRRLVEGEG